MILIAHRGNHCGSNYLRENSVSYIEEAIKLGYEVEIDIWVKNDEIWLGHDYAKYPCSINFLKKNSKKLWIHCKNLEALFYLNQEKNLNVFFHDIDDATLTSHGYIWTYPSKPLMPNSICVMPELGVKGNIKECYGICSNFIANYAKFV